MATIKKGTHRFNDVLTAPSNEDAYFSERFNYTCNGHICEEFDVGDEDGLIYANMFESVGTTQEQIFVYSSVAFNDFVAGWQSADYQTITVPYDQEVSDAFEPWFTANTKLVGGDAVTIEYNGAVIASLKAGQSATLSCKDKPMLTDVVVSVPDGMGAGEVVEEWDGSIEVV